MADEQPLEPELPELEKEQFPPDARTPEQRLRYRRCVAVARQLFEGDGEAAIWQAAHSMYRNPNLAD